MLEASFMLRFQRKIEVFQCEHCATEVDGDGYTNHCPSCLWSKHVDIWPGDRKATCRGLMRPVGAEIRKGGHRLVHECVHCGYRSTNRLAVGDNMERYITIMTESANRN